ncbi:MAG: KTSC domain-containing protein [Chloroflexia bacterium]
MHRDPVSSSNLRSVGYDPVEKVLEIEFKENRVYQYYDVPEHVYKGLMTAASKGSYFDAHIKYAFQTRRIT